MDINKDISNEKLLDLTIFSWEQEGAKFFFSIFNSKKGYVIRKYFTRN